MAQSRNGTQTAEEELSCPARNGGSAVRGRKLRRRCCAKAGEAKPVFGQINPSAEAATGGPGTDSDRRQRRSSTEPTGRSARQPSAMISPDRGKAGCVWFHPECGQVALLAGLRPRGDRRRLTKPRTPRKPTGEQDRTGMQPIHNTSEQDESGEAHLIPSASPAAETTLPARGPGRKNGQATVRQRHSAASHVKKGGAAEVTPPTIPSRRGHSRSDQASTSSASSSASQATP